MKSITKNQKANDTTVQCFWRALFLLPARTSHNSFRYCRRSLCFSMERQCLWAARVVLHFFPLEEAKGLRYFRHLQIW